MKFEADGQFYYAIISLATGYLSGVLTFIFEVPRLLKNKIIRLICAIVRAAIAAVLFVAVKYYYNFPDLRFYMPICFLLGFITYKKTFAQIIAIFAEKLYNKLTKNFNLWRKRINDAREKKKNSRRKHGGNGYAAVHSYRGYDISNDKHHREKGKNKSTQQSNRATQRRAKIS